MAAPARRSSRGPLGLTVVALAITLGAAAWAATEGRTTPRASPPGSALAHAPVASVASASTGGSGSVGSGSPGPSGSLGVPGSAATPTPSSGPTATPSTRPSGATLPTEQLFGFGGHLMWHDVATAVSQLDMLQADGFRTVRFDVSWHDLEPQRSTYAYLDKLDTVIAAAAARGIRPIITVIETPGWANGGRSRWVPPDDPNDYATFVGLLAGRYAGRVLGWEVWNEPDLELFWRPKPDAADYTRMLIATSAAIRSADPSALVLGGSIAFGNTDFVRSMYAHGAKGTFDALALHPYTLTLSPEDESDPYHSLTLTLDNIHAVMVRNNDGSVPIWVTEFGWATVGLNSVSTSARVAYLPRAVAVIRQRPWVGALIVYTINTADSQRYGLSTDGRRSDAWVAYADAVRRGH